MKKNDVMWQAWPTKTPRRETRENDERIATRNARKREKKKERLMKMIRGVPTKKDNVMRHNSLHEWGKE